MPLSHRNGSNIMTMKLSTSGGSTITGKLPLAPSSGTATCTFGSTGL